MSGIATDGVGRSRTGGIVALCAILVTALNLRIAVTSLSPLLQQVGDELRFGVALRSVFAMLPAATFAVFAAATVLAIGRLGEEQLAAGAMVVTAIGEAARAAAPNAAVLLALSVVSLAGAGVAGVLIPPLIRRHFPGRTAAMSSGYLVAFHVGALTPPLLVVALAAGIGWRLPLGGWAVIAVAAALLWGVVLVQQRQAPGAVTAPSGRLPNPSSTYLRNAWRSRSVRNLTLLFGAVSGDVYILFSWLPTLVVDDGFSPAFGGAMVSLLIGVSLVVAVFAPRMVLRAPHAGALIAVSAGLYVVGWAGLALLPRDAMVLWIVVLGVASSLVVVVQTMITTHSRTAHGATVTSAFVQGFGGLIAVIGPLGFGLLHAVTGSWMPSFGLAGASVIVIAVCAFREPRHRTLEDEVDEFVGTLASAPRPR